RSPRLRPKKRRLFLGFWQSFVVLCETSYGQTKYSKWPPSLLPRVREADGLGGGGGLLAHVGDKALVELLGGVVAHLLQRLRERGDLDHPRHVAAGADVELHVRHLQAEDLVVIFLEAGALLDHVGCPFVE